ncbi:ABC transporter permease subunit, partial [Rhizobium leguminosarum]
MQRQEKLVEKPFRLQDLGCTPIKAFWRVTFPLSIPGVVAGCMLVFIPAVGEFVIPDLL